MKIFIVLLLSWVFLVGASPVPQDDDPAATTEDPSVTASGETGGDGGGDETTTEDPSVTAASGETTTEDPSVTAASGETTTEDPSVTAASGETTTVDPSATDGVDEEQAEPLQGASDEAKAAAEKATAEKDAAEKAAAEKAAAEKAAAEKAAGDKAAADKDDANKTAADNPEKENLIPMVQEVSLTLGPSDTMPPHVSKDRNGNAIKHSTYFDIPVEGSTVRIYSEIWATRYTVPATKSNCMCLTRGPLSRFKLIGNIHFKKIKPKKTRPTEGTTAPMTTPLCPPCDCFSCYPPYATPPGMKY